MIANNSPYKQLRWDREFRERALLNNGFEIFYDYFGGVYFVKNGQRRRASRLRDMPTWEFDEFVRAEHKARTHKRMDSLEAIGLKVRFDCDGVMIMQHPDCSHIAIDVDWIMQLSDTDFSEWHDKLKKQCEEWSNKHED